MKLSFLQHFLTRTNKVNTQIEFKSLSADEAGYLNVGASDTFIPEAYKPL